MNSIVTLFENAIKNDRLSHLYLISGSDRDRNFKLAANIAYKIFSNGTNDRDLMNQIATLCYPNLYQIAKEDKSLKKEQIISLQEEFSKTSLLPGKRVYIINDVETLTNSAANSLLKFLEEPKSDDVIGFLLTTNKDVLLPTILSRVQVISVHEETSREKANNLISKGMDRLDARIISLTSLNPKIIDVTSDSEYLLLKDFFLRTVSFVDKKDIIYGLKINEFFVSNSNFFKYYLDLLLNYYLDLIIVKNNPKEVYFLDFQDDLNKNIDIETINSIISVIQDAKVKVDSFVNVDSIFMKILLEIKKGSESL